MQQVAQRFEAEYKKDAAGLNCLPPTVQPRATEHIQQILDIVADLIAGGHAYVARNGDVYFRVRSDAGYGKLSHLNLDDLESGNRAPAQPDGRRPERGPRRLCGVEGGQARRARLGQPLRPRPSRLAHRVAAGMSPHPSGQGPSTCTAAART